MVDQISSVSGLLVIQTDAERDAFIKGVAVKTKETTDKMKEISTQRQRAYELACLDRQDQYKQFIQQVNIRQGIEQH
jgi:hypothetical protein